MEYGKNKQLYIIANEIGAFEIFTKNVGNYLERIDFIPGLHILQKALVSGTARATREVLEYSK